MAKMQNYPNKLKHWSTRNQTGGLRTIKSKKTKASAGPLDDSYSDKNSMALAQKQTCRLT